MQQVNTQELMYLPEIFMIAIIQYSFSTDLEK